MSFGSNRLSYPRAKVGRAKKHIQDLDIAIKDFFSSNPYKVGTKRDPNSQRLIYYLTEVKEVPFNIAVITGDAIQNMRSALDHLAYQLVVVGSASSGPFRHVYFPICDSAEKYSKRRQNVRMLPAALQAIDMIQPFKGGNDQLWRLHQLNLVDKHRLLIMVGSYFQNVDIGTRLNEIIKENFPDFISDFGEITTRSIFLNPADNLFPLKAGDELFIDLADAKVNEKIRFRFDISLSEPKVIEGEPILTTLKQFLDITEKIVESFNKDIYWSP